MMLKCILKLISATIRHGITAAAIFMAPQIVHAQLLFNNGTGITLTSGSTLTVLGDISSTGISSFSNNGTIELSGDWINNSTAPVFGTS